MTAVKKPIEMLSIDELRSSTNHVEGQDVSSFGVLQQPKFDDQSYSARFRSIQSCPEKTEKLIRLADAESSRACSAAGASDAPRLPSPRADAPRLPSPRGASDSEASARTMPESAFSGTEVVGAKRRLPAPPPSESSEEPEGKRKGKKGRKAKEARAKAKSTQTEMQAFSNYIYIFIFN